MGTHYLVVFIARFKDGLKLIIVLNVLPALTNIIMGRYHQYRWQLNSLLLLFYF
jgi:maltodextrin utilization protein YvdJ